MEQEAIKIQSINKSYSGKRVLNNVSFSVRKGTIHGFIGPNGAGKTTTLSILMRLVLPSPGSGDIYNEGKSVKNDPTFNEKLGFIPAEPHFPGGAKVKEYVLDCAGLSSDN